MLAICESRAANPAYDDASDPAYSIGWTNGSNGGYGFDPWILTVFGTGTHFVGTSTVNGDGDSDNDGDIDISGRAWGFSTGHPSILYAVRSFTGGPLSLFQPFSVDFDTGFIFDPDKGSMGIELWNSGLDAIYFRFNMVTNSPFYFFSDASGPDQLSPVPFSDEGGRFTFQLTSPTNYLVQITMLGGGSYSWAGNIDGAPGAFAAFLGAPETANADPPYHFYINRLEIVPEPSVWLFLVLGGTLIALRQRTKSLSEPAGARWSRNSYTGGCA
jgi:hypothetical protein